MQVTTKPTDQRAGVRPISFVMQKWGGDFYAPVTLAIRPTDLTMNAPLRASVTQSLGRDISGWADNFGRGLPSCTIAGHTGWRVNQATGLDGIQSFMQLNDLVTREYPEAKQAAIDAGADPDLVKLIFVDMLDEIVWSVLPNTFVLQRSKSSPLLMRYNIQLQAISTDIDNPFKLFPDAGSVSSGLSALDRAIAKLRDFAGWINDRVQWAIGVKDAVLKPVAAVVQKFTDLSVAIFDTVNHSVTSVKSLVGGTANSLIGIASNVAQVGINIYRSFAAIDDLDDYTRNALSRVSSAYNEISCIFRNSLRPRQSYEEYEDLYGASNCSSTTGGRNPSQFEFNNVFAMMEIEKPAVYQSSAAQAGIENIKRSDPVLRPMSIGEIGSNLQAINSGIKVAA